MKATAAALILLLLAATGFGDQGTSSNDDLDSLFEEDILEEPDSPATAGEAFDQEGLFNGDVLEQAGEQPEAPPEEAFLVSQRLEWGGRFDASFTAQAAWGEYPGSREALFLEGTPSLSSRVAADLYFDARPERDFRVFGKLKAAYEYPFDWEVAIFELFSDFQYGDLLFFRVGKQTVQWGVGYFFSPADVLNLVSIDPEEPEAEREGPLSLKVQLPFGANNAYLYLVADNILRPYKIALAPKLELVLGSYELGVGAFYRSDLTPKGMLTLTGPLWELDLFAEAMLQWGSDRTFVSSSPPPLTYSIDDRLLFSGTVGFGYLNQDWNLSIFGQYFYNGQGYEGGLGLLSPLVTAAQNAGEISAADLLYPGRHYLAFSAGWSELLDSPLSFSVLWLANLSDRSGLVAPSLSWELFERFTLSTGLRLGYGTAGDEYALFGAAPAFTLAASLGGGRF